MGGCALDTSSTDGDVDLCGLREYGTSKGFLLGLGTTDDWNGEQLLVAAGVVLEDLADEAAGVLQVNMGGVAFLPEELTRPDERSRVLELPSHNV